MVNVDIHAHILPERAMARMGEAAPAFAPHLENRTDDTGDVVVGGVTRYRAFPRGGWDLDRRLAYMDAVGLDVQALSVTVFTYGYEVEVPVGAAVARIQNEEIATVVRDHPDRFVGLATLPMQDPPAAAAELRRAMQDLDMRGASICTHIMGKNLDAPEFDPVWQAAQDLGAFLFFHPEQPAAADRLGSYYLTNFVGNPLDTTIAVTSMVFGGVYDRFPRLTTCFAHGGGFVPYQRGRFDHGWRVRSEAKAHLKYSPDETIGRLYYDTILHSAASLAFLVDTMGADHVLLGTDYPFDMGPDDPVGDVRGIKRASAAEQEQILGETAQRLLKMKG